MVVVEVFLTALVVFLAIVAAYQWGLALCALMVPWPEIPMKVQERKFLVLIPAHDEESGLPDTLASLANLEYPKELYTVVVIADRCTDATSRIAIEKGVRCYERLTGDGMKGAAIAWGIQQIVRDGIVFDALIIVDADTTVSPKLLAAFCAGFENGCNVQQAFSYISNPWETAFTRIIAVTSMLKNGLFYAGKSRVGLPGMLQGTGICLKKSVIDQYGWNAFSVGEDWEFTVSLLLEGERIHFNPTAFTYAKESSGVRQASHQRLRWASGRYAVMGASVLRLFKEAYRKRSIGLADAAITFICPNYSTQASLALACTGAAWALQGFFVNKTLFQISLSVLGAFALYFLVGVLKTESPLRTIAGLPYILVFLPWRLGIEVMGMLGFGRKKWGRSARNATPKMN